MFEFSQDSKQILGVIPSNIEGTPEKKTESKCTHEATKEERSCQHATNVKCGRAPLATKRQPQHKCNAGQ